MQAKTLPMVPRKKEKKTKRNETKNETQIISTFIEFFATMFTATVHCTKGELVCLV